MCLMAEKLKISDFNLTNLNKFHSLEAVDRVSEKQIPGGQIYNYII